MTEQTPEERAVIDIANDVLVESIQAELDRRYAPAPAWDVRAGSDYTVIVCVTERCTIERRLEITCPGHAEFAARLVSWLRNHSISPNQRS